MPACLAVCNSFGDPPRQHQNKNMLGTFVKCKNRYFIGFNTILSWNIMYVKRNRTILVCCSCRRCSRAWTVDKHLEHCCSCSGCSQSYRVLEHREFEKTVRKEREFPCKTAEKTVSDQNCCCCNVADSL